MRRPGQHPRHPDPEALSRSTRIAVGAQVGLTTGLAIVLAVNPGSSARRGGYSDFLAAFRAVDAVMSRVAPPVFLSTALSGVIAAATTSRGDPGGAAFRLASAALVGAAIRSTVTVNLGLNEQIRSWATDDEPDRWQDVRARWDHGHHVRTGLVGAAALVAWAASPAARSRLHR